MKLNIRNLVIELTRRCNMSCAHCLRGDTENKDISDSAIRDLFERNNIGGISTVTFTGGEPSLRTDLIDCFFETAKEFGVDIGSFYVVTNGKENQMDLAISLIKAYGECSDKDMCGVCISHDVYHEKIKDQNPLQAFSFFRNDKDYDDYRLGTLLVKEGRAGGLGLGRSISHQEHLEIETWNDEVNIEEMYLNVNGDILAGCDMSYTTQEVYSICNVKDLPNYIESLLSEECECAA